VLVISRLGGVLLVSLGLSSVVISGVAAIPHIPARGISPSAFRLLAEKGAEGSFELHYQVSGVDGADPLAGDGTLVVAQRTPAGLTAWPSAWSMWSFQLLETNGRNYQWIESGLTAALCWKWSKHPALTCSGQVAFEPFNGFVTLVEPFVPETVLGSLRDDINTPGLRPNLTSFSSRGTQLTGTVTCLRVDEAHGSTTCLTRSGLVASEVNYYVAGFPWASVQLETYRANPPASDFVLEGSVTKPTALPPI
jgi:hypothetical protein